METDARGKRVVPVIHCVLNHNARVPGAARYAGMNRDLVDLLQKREVGILQMPCPEMTCMDLPRSRPPGSSIRDVLDTPEGRACCARLSAAVADSIEEFLRHGYEVPAVLGGDVDSPGCAVHLSVSERGETIAGEESGVFIRTLHEELRRRGIEIPFRGIRDSDPEKMQEDLAWLEERLAGL